MPETSEQRKNRIFYSQAICFNCLLNAPAQDGSGETALDRKNSPAQQSFARNWRDGSLLVCPAVFQGLTGKPPSVKGVYTPLRTDALPPAGCLHREAHEALKEPPPAMAETSTEEIPQLPKAPAKPVKPTGKP
jgi:hypothetical protein